MATRRGAEYKEGVSTESPEPESPEPESPEPESPESEAPIHVRPVDRRPRSPWSVWALATTFLFGVLGIFGGFFWTVLLVPLVVGVLALRRIRPDVSKGKGMAVLAVALSILFGSCQFMVARTARGVAEHLGAGAMAALASEEPERLNAWLTKEAVEGGAPDRIRARFAKVVEMMGPYRREVRTGSILLGALPIALPPTQAEEIGVGEEASEATRTGGFWVEALFEKGPVHVELRFPAESREGIEQAVDQPDKPAPVLADVHFFRKS